ncbi:class I adenylate-forming enzyme family protein [Phenylobacterium sp.]|uniref:class I adenylate-forming enzyme family protein n=1 Tax=Phenylobacterium sp. TaxID=1871053 RepID=UPI0025F7A0BE|nr:class I adenylate-forming enzyme family protein [Phenylobacterium sp.]MBX3483931.1 acyl--CoA ligase [Phenylobacterium sp.]
MFDSYIAYHAKTRPRALALVTPRRRATYAELDADIDRFAGGLQALGIGPGRGIVAVDATSTYHHHLLILALARLGVASTPREDAGADLVLTQREPRGDGRQAVRLDAAWTARTEAAPPTPVPTAPRDPDSIARVMLSSGTTSTPKRIPLTWRRVAANGLNGLSVYGADRLGPWIIRTGVDSGIGYMMASLAWTAGAGVAADFGAADIPGLMERHHPGVLGLTPIQLRDLLGNLPRGFELKSGWRIVVGGGVLPASVAREARMRLSPDIAIVYGSTESGRATAGPAARLDRDAGFAGWALPGVEIDIVGPDGATLPDGEAGELRIRSDRLAEGYLGDAAASAQVFRDGWYYSGDLARRLPDGAYVIDGRIDERMNIGGVKVMPNLLEDAALACPGVHDAAAFALPDRRGQDELWIAVVALQEITRETLMTYLAKCPQRLPAVRIAWSEAIPRNAMGKIERTVLREQVQAALAAGQA